MAVQNVNEIKNCKKYKSRFIYSNTEYCGTSVNWKHDWYKFAKKSYADMANKSVNKTDSVQVDNYPCTVSEKGHNCMSRMSSGSCAVAKLVNTKQRHSLAGTNHEPNDIYCKSKVQEGSGIVNACKNVNFDRKSKVHYVTNGHVGQSDKNPCVDGLMSLTIDQLAPVATHNRFWPLSDQLNVKPQ